MNLKEIKAYLREHPADLWDLMNSNLQKVLGPWEEARSEARNVSYHKGTWRCDREGKNLVVVVPSRKLREPELEEFDTGDYYFDDDGEEYPIYSDEAYEEALAAYNEELPRWKPWTAHYQNTKHYADTPEEAQALADTLLRADGWHLVGGVP